MNIISVVGARPNFIKMAPFHKELLKVGYKYPESNMQHRICQTGQHYDENMSKVFFKYLELPKPVFYLGVGFFWSMSHSGYSLCMQ